MRADGPSPGARAVAVVDLRPNGVVRLGGEEWSATSPAGPVAAGAAVEVVERVGLRLVVRPVEGAAGLAFATVKVSSAPDGQAPAAGAEPAGPAPLTAREREVAALITRGLTNRQIAAQLVVAETTVDRHVSHILAKLGFATRSQVAVWFARQGTALEPR